MRSIEPGYPEHPGLLRRWCHPGPDPEPRPRCVIRPEAGWQPLNFRELWRYRELVGFLAWRDVKVRYKQTVLGAAWAVLQPVMMTVVFTIFFARMGGVSSGDCPYPVFAYAGLLPWTFFAAGNSVVGSERLVTKIYFPRLALPFAAVSAAVVDFAIACSILLVLLLAYGVSPGPSLFLAPLVFALILLAALGMGALVAALNVSYRDFRYVIPFLLQVWMFATPTIYLQPHEENNGLRLLASLNPMTDLIESFRASLLGQAVPWPRLAVAAVCAVGLFLVGCFYFRRVEDRFADIL